MNELINFIILGMIQGLTEFFPVSSSGHLVLFQDILSINNEGASAEIIAHFGTLVNQKKMIILEFFSCILVKSMLHYKHNNKQGKIKNAIQCRSRKKSLLQTTRHNTCTT